MLQGHTWAEDGHQKGHVRLQSLVCNARAQQEPHASGPGVRMLQLPHASHPDAHAWLQAHIRTETLRETMGPPFTHGARPFTDSHPGLLGQEDFLCG